MNIVNQSANERKVKVKSFPKCRNKRRDANIKEIAIATCEKTLALALRLEKIAPKGSLADAKALRMRECAGKQNVWIAKNLQNKDGKFFDGSGGSFNCGCQLCPRCSSLKSRRNRPKARAAVNKLNLIFSQKSKKRLGLRWRSVLLTMPLMKGSDPIAATERIHNAFKIMIDRDFWKTRVMGGIRGTEFTVRYTGDESTGFHVHIHLLLLSKFIAVDADKAKQFERHLKKFNLSNRSLKAEWRYCLTKAGATFDSQIKYKDLVVSVMDTKNRSDQIRGDKTLESALLETCAYMCKNDDLENLNDKDLINLVEIDRWNRMFSTLGAGSPSFEITEDLIKANDISDADASLVPYPNITSGNADSTNKSLRNVKRPSWRTEWKTREYSDYVVWQLHEIERIRMFERRRLGLTHHLAQFETLDGSRKWDFETIEAEIRENEVRFAKFKFPPKMRIIEIDPKPVTKFVIRRTRINSWAELGN
jgi:hypothetical protein